MDKTLSDEEITLLRNKRKLLKSDAQELLDALLEPYSLEVESK
ncbi:MAG: hypothetical protein V1702_00800 [Candidatus Woesearchaeota archaeon]